MKLAKEMCQICHRHEADSCYTDEARGLQDVPMCDACLVKHLEKWYPQALRMIEFHRERAIEKQQMKPPQKNKARREVKP